MCRSNQKNVICEAVEVILSNEFRTAFGDLDYAEIESYLNLFDDDLKNPKSMNIDIIKKENDDIQRFRADDRNIYPKGGRFLTNVKMFKGFDELNIDDQRLLIFKLKLLNNNGNKNDKIESAAELKKYAEMGDEYAMIFYSEALCYGSGVSVNLEEAAMYMKRAADLGNVSAIRVYADMLHEGIGVPKNISKAIEYIKDAADKGHTEAMYNYGVCLEFGDGIEENKEEAAKYYYAASFKGNAEAMVRLAKMIYLGKICNCTFNKLLAYDLFCQSAKFGSKEGMLYCALLLREGEVFKVDLKKSTEYFQMAAEKGFSLAYHDYAYCLYYGIGINANKIEASKYLKLAIDDENNNYDIVKKNEIMEFYANMQ